MLRAMDYAITLLWICSITAVGSAKGESFPCDSFKAASAFRRFICSVVFRQQSCGDATAGGEALDEPSLEISNVPGECPVVSGRWPNRLLFDESGRGTSEVGFENQRLHN